MLKSVYSNNVTHIHTREREEQLGSLVTQRSIFLENIPAKIWNVGIEKKKIYYAHES